MTWIMTRAFVDCRWLYLKHVYVQFTSLRVNVPWVFVNVLVAMEIDHAAKKWLDSEHGV